MSQPVDIDLLLSQVRAALAAGDWDRAVALIESLRPPDRADLFGELPPEEQDALLPRLDVEDSAEILEELGDREAAELAARLDTETLAQILDEMEPDEAADLLADIPPAQAIQAPLPAGPHRRRQPERHRRLGGPQRRQPAPACPPSAD
ncbi:MAG: magnesium transporter MgtE N-terminal domain-containing protein [Anaerolineae bacterium]